VPVCVSVGPSQMLETAFNDMREHQVASALVLKDGQLLGILTPENIGEFIVMESALRRLRKGSTGAFGLSSSAAISGGRSI